MEASSVEAVLNLWFGEPTSPEFGQVRDSWFRKDAAFDRALGDRFGSLYDRAARGELDAWRSTATSCLALTIVLDQFPRNLFRGSAQAFGTDDRALDTARHAIAQGFDRDLLPVQRWFFYLPFEHSESLADQETSLRLWDGLRDHPASAGAIDFARRHWDVVTRFGRFPHRNALLGRSSTPEELEFLPQPGSSF